MTEDPALVLLTAAFPFGNKSETFLETEVPVLAERFPRVLVLPSRREPGVRPLPHGVELVEMPWLDGFGSAGKRAALLSAEATRVVAAAAARPAGWAAWARGWRTYLDLLATNVIKARMLDAWIGERGLAGAVFYDYWFENSTLALALLRRRSRIGVAVSRAHGFDLYDERWAPLQVPFRNAKLADLDAVFPVSSFGARYLEARAGRHRHKIRVMRLGVPEPPACDPVAETPPLVVSVGSIEPHKRIGDIPAVLEALGEPVRWVHFGDGSRMPEVERAARALPERVRWELRGHVDNRELLHFYRRHRVDALLSLSRQEGLPVSMMEAIGHGVPVVAAAVQGVPEIVNDTTGVRLGDDPSTGEAAGALARALRPGAFDPERIRAFFREHYLSTVNYNAFADALLDLAKDPAAGP